MWAQLRPQTSPRPKQATQQYNTLAYHNQANPPTSLQNPLLRPQPRLQTLYTHTTAPLPHTSVNGSPATPPSTPAQNSQRISQPYMSGVGKGGTTATGRAVHVPVRRDLRVSRRLCVICRRIRAIGRLCVRSVDSIFRRRRRLRSI